MKFEIASYRAAALAALMASVDAAGHGHGHHHHHPRPGNTTVTVEKRNGQCQFPTNVGLVPVTPDQQNAGWAMSPNQPCKPGSYCPYACPSGQVSMQWDPKATSYAYPLSMNGGLFCDENGHIQKPFPDKPYCEDGTGAVSAVNKASQHVAFCQTVLPGNEAMIIPTVVQEAATLAVPGSNYWCGTASQFYINAPGVSAEEGCVWGTAANPLGNWSPYTAGANTDPDGVTFLKIGWNPIYLEPTTPFRNEKPGFGIEVLCDGDGCSGLPCKIDPAVNLVNEMVGSIFKGAGGASGCVVTVPKGSKANIVVFEKDASGDASSETVPVSTSTAASSSHTSTSTASATSSSTTSTAALSSTSSPTSTSTPTPTHTSTPSHLSTHTPAHRSSSVYSSTYLPKSSPSLSYTYRPQVLAPTSSADISETVAATTSAAASASTSPSLSSSKNGATSTVVSGLTLVLGAVAAMIVNV